MNVQLAENNLAEVVGQDVILSSPQSLPAIWIVVDEEDWSGVNDCGAIYMPDQNLAKGLMSIDNSHIQPSQEDWPIESCS